MFLGGRPHVGQSPRTQKQDFQWPRETATVPVGKGTQRRSLCSTRGLQLEFHSAWGALIPYC